MTRLCAALVALALLVGACSSGEDAAPAPSGGQPLLVVDGPDAAGWVRLLRVSGAAARVGTLDELLDRPAGVVGGRVVLTVEQRERVRRWVQEGGRLVTPHDDVLADLGVERAPTASLDGLGEEVRWAEPLDVDPLLGDDLDVVAAAGETVVAATADRRDGAVLALAIDPLADGRDGHELVPDLGRVARRWTGAPPGPVRTGIEVYVDPGALPDDLVDDPVRLAAGLASARAVHLAGWNGDFRDPADNTDYAAVIDALHAHGVLVYAWLEPPFVSLRFWDDHPQCRERTASGADAHVDWRLLIALEDERCFEQAMDVYRRLLTEFDFDGVNVAELYFEPPPDPAVFTPFHPSALAQFGGDPVADPEGFLRFRTDLVTRLNERVLQFINGLPVASAHDLQLTVIDDRLDPVLAEGVGSDVDALAEVARRQGATLQLEDPFTQWAEGPLRYDDLGETLAGLDDVRAFVDVNVVDRAGARPTARMTGAELDLAVGAAAAVRGVLGLFSAATVTGVDREHLDGAIASAARTPDEGVVADWTTIVTGPPGRDGRVTVDGKAWPVADGRTVVPAGEHRLEWSAGPSAGPALLKITAEVGALSGDRRRLRIAYSAKNRVYAVVSEKPTNLASIRNPAGGWTVVLPAGTDEVTLRFGG